MLKQCWWASRGRLLDNQDLPHHDLGLYLPEDCCGPNQFLQEYFLSSYWASWTPSLLTLRLLGLRRMTFESSLKKVEKWSKNKLSNCDEKTHIILLKILRIRFWLLLLYRLMTKFYVLIATNFPRNSSLLEEH